MNTDPPLTPREELEMRLTALLMGELPLEEAAAVQTQIAADPELAALHGRLRKAMELLREASALPEPSAPPTPAQLSNERRGRLLAHFKTPVTAPRPAPAPIIKMPRRDWSGVRMGIAAALIAFIGIGVMLPDFLRARKRSQSTRILEDLRVIDSKIDQYAMENSNSLPQPFATPAPAAPAPFDDASKRAWGIQRGTVDFLRRETADAGQSGAVRLQTPSPNATAYAIDKSGSGLWGESQSATSLVKAGAGTVVVLPEIPAGVTALPRSAGAPPTMATVSGGESLATFNYNAFDTGVTAAPTVTLGGSQTEAATLGKAALTVNGGGFLDLNGTNQSVGNLNAGANGGASPATAKDTSTLVLTGGNTFTGGVSVDSGSMAASNVNSFGGTITGTGGTTMTNSLNFNNNGGAVILNPEAKPDAANTYSGATVVTGGTLSVSSGGPLSIGPATSGTTLAGVAGSGNITMGGSEVTFGSASSNTNPPPVVAAPTFTTASPASVPTLSAINTTNLSTPTFQVAQPAPVIKAPPADAMNKALASVPPLSAVTAGKRMDVLQKRSDNTESDLIRETNLGMASAERIALPNHEVAESRTPAPVIKAPPEDAMNKALASAPYDSLSLKASSLADPSGKPPMGITATAGTNIVINGGRTLELGDSANLATDSPLIISGSIVQGTNRPIALEPTWDGKPVMLDKDKDGFPNEKEFAADPSGAKNQEVVTQAETEAKEIAKGVSQLPASLSRGASAPSEVIDRIGGRIKLLESDKPGSTEEPNKSGSTAERERSTRAEAERNQQYWRAKHLSAGEAARPALSPAPAATPMPGANAKRDDEPGLIGGYAAIPQGRGKAAAKDGPAVAQAMDLQRKESQLIQDMAAASAHNETIRNLLSKYEVRDVYRNTTATANGYSQNQYAGSFWDTARTNSALDQGLTQKSAPNLLRDLAVASINDKEVRDLLATHGYNVQQQVTAPPAKPAEAVAMEVAKLNVAKKQLAELEQPKTPDKAEQTVSQQPKAPADTPQPEVQTSANPFSTFSLNVSDVSFKLAAASLEQSHMPDPSSVRSEEFVNAFDYRDPEPAPGAPLAFAAERARYPFAQNRDLLRFSVKTAAAGRQPGRPLNIVLLLDKSGSMERADRVNIVREALRVLVTELQPQDKLSIVTFARTPRLWADGVAGDKAGEMIARVSEITPEGGTNLEAALDLGYATALRHYTVSSVSRVVLFTDGAANLGDVNPEALTKKVEEHRKQGVALDCFGIGWEGYNDDLLEQLTRNADGRYGFINTPEEAGANFATQLAGALRVAASDVKVQVEFNPKRVTAYRQVGYAKHQLTKEQFRDNSVNAAQIGAAESGNALYVVEVDPRGEGDLATVRVRFRVPGTSDYREHEWAVPFAGNAQPLEQAGPALRLAGTAGAFSEMLAANPYAAEVTDERLLGMINGVPGVYGADPRPKKLEWMIRQAMSLSGR